jgi:hypothetical protein
MNPWLLETLRSGTIASLVMMPAGAVFKWLDWRVGHYGPKFATLWTDAPGPIFLFAQHLLIGWLSTWPLLWALVRSPAPVPPIVAGAAYGAAYYAAINAWALPMYFGDPLPWRLGLTTVLPSLVVHVIFGASIGWTSRRFVAERRPPVA